MAEYVTLNNGDFLDREFGQGRMVATTKADGDAAALSDAPRCVAMLIYPGVAPLDVAGPLQVFGVANFLRKRKLYDIVTVAPTAAPVP